MEHTKEQVKAELKAAMNIAKDSPLCSLSDEELQKRFEDLSTDENLETLSKLLTVADGEKPEKRKIEKTTITVEVLTDTADKLNTVYERHGIPVGEQIDRMTFNFHPYDVGLAAHLICEEILSCTVNFDQAQFNLTIYMVLNILKKCFADGEPDALRRIVDELIEVIKAKGTELPDGETE